MRETVQDPPQEEQLVYALLILHLIHRSQSTNLTDTHSTGNEGQTHLSFTVD